MWLRDPKTKQKSATLTFFTIGFIVALVKLLFEGLQVGSFSMGDFGGSDFATVVGSIGTIYTARKFTDKEKK